MTQSVATQSPSNRLTPGSKDIDPNSIVSSRLRSNKPTQDAGKTTTPNAVAANPEPHSKTAPADASQVSDSTPARMTRQRTAHLAHNDDSPTTHKEDDSPIPTSAASNEPISQICVCQPEPKIPRPRNGMYEKHQV